MWIYRYGKPTSHRYCPQGKPWFSISRCPYPILCHYIIPANILSTDGFIYAKPGHDQLFHQSLLCSWTVHWVEYGMVSHKHGLFGISISTNGNWSPFSGSACKTSEISFQLTLDEWTKVFMGYVRPIVKGPYWIAAYFGLKDFRQGGIFQIWACSVALCLCGTRSNM